MARRSIGRGCIGVGARLSAALILSGFCLLAFAARAADPPVLRVGTSADYPPLTFYEGGQVKGIEADFARELEQGMKRRVEIQRMPFVDLIPALVAGRIDLIMSGMSVTPERRERVRFTEPYLRVGQMALVRNADLPDRPRRGLSDTPQIRIGFRPGTTGETYLRSAIKQAQLVPMDSIEAGVQALRDKRIDYFVHDAPTIWRIVGGLLSTETELTGLYRPLTEEYLAWAVRKDDAALADQLNTALAQWRAEGRLDVVLDSWIRVRRIEVD
jgi:polar amino acid transport system substrate-binding protein